MFSLIEQLERCTSVPYHYDVRCKIKRGTPLAVAEYVRGIDAEFTATFVARDLNVTIESVSKTLRRLAAEKEFRRVRKTKAEGYIWVKLVKSANTSA